MRSLLLASLLLGATIRQSAAQSPLLHEVRSELFITSPRIHGFGATVIVEQHLEADDLSPNERIQGLGIVSPVVHGMSLGSEVRQVLTPTGVEHRYVQTMLATVPVFAGFAIRNRTRLEMRDINTKWSRRYLNRTALGHDVDVLGSTLFPYVQADLSYDTRFSMVNRRESTIGVRIPFGHGVNVDSYLTRQSDLKRSPLLLLAGGTIIRVAL
ncbi:MAG: hypothetical protein ABJE47_05110 [bacterium]